MCSINTQQVQGKCPSTELSPLSEGQGEFGRDTSPTSVLAHQLLQQRGNQEGQKEALSHTSSSVTRSSVRGFYLLAPKETLTH